MNQFPGVQSSPGQTYFVQQMGQELGPLTLQQLQVMVKSGQVKHDSLARMAEGPTTGWFQAKEIPGLFSTKEWLVALLLSVFLGTFAIDRFYLGHVWVGILKLITCGGFGIWVIVDIILIALRKVEDKNGMPLR